MFQIQFTSRTKNWATYTLATAIFLSSCGELSHKPAAAAPVAPAGDPNAVATAPGPDQELLDAIDFESRVSEGKVANTCSNILTATGQDIYVKEGSVQSASSNISSLSKLSISELKSEHEAYVNAANSWGANGTAGLKQGQLGMVDKDFNLGLAATSSTSQSSFNYAASFKKLTDFLASRDESHDTYQSSDSEFKASLSEVGLAAYSKCITGRAVGLICDTEILGDTVSFHVGWSPNDTIRKKLPSLAIRLVASENLTMTRNEFPSRLGIGTGEIVLFKRVSRVNGVVLQVVATDPSGTINLQCANFIK
jgi:hypothetical protein